MQAGWLLIFTMFNQFVGDERGHVTVSQQTPIIYQSVADCHEDLLKRVDSRLLMNVKFIVERFDERSHAYSVNQSGSQFILQHQYECLKIESQ